MTGAARCRPSIVSAGLPGRTELMLDRDTRRYPTYATVVAAGRRTRHEPNGDELLHATLIERLRPDASPDVSEQAAWVAGRCTTGDAEADAATRTALDALIEDSSAGTYIEAVFSAALLDSEQIERGRAMLTRLVSDTSANYLDTYLAAARLAQLGSPAGYPALHQELHDDTAHSRLMAARELAAFLPYDGQTVDGLTIDVLGELTERLRDEDEMGASEVPDLLLELGLPGSREAVERALGRGYRKPVRDAAKLALEWLAHQPAKG